ncbi:5-formyltetrahydrofolate cyclo-ligase [Iodidimonas sp. SYSU 1G8]|uniref:5-formyltetrahydrofolate cyclo-ligase n=1 Tax=Iodidimonas sp. SYSU 1G8 TaxID=3133967 RepID=UPI0031FE63AE
MNEPSPKTELRRRAAGRRDALASGERDIGERLVASFAAAGLLRPAGVVAGYAPFRSEADPGPLLRVLSDAGWTCALPVPVGGADGLAFRAWSPGAPLVAGRYGIPVPPETAEIVRPQLVLVPLLAYDGAGGRLGYGAGYYDRALAALRRDGPVVAMGVAYAGQEMASVPTEDHDQPLDMILTEDGVTDFRKAAR